jgi:L-aminopeptidase/D-esterase-like protein
MASTQVQTDSGPITVAALAVVNSAGSVIDPTSGLPWERVKGLRRPSNSERAALRAAGAAATTRLNTTIGVVATDAGFGRAECGRMAIAAHDGLARAIRPAHLLVDGDTVFALATGNVTEGRVPVRLADRLFAAAADVFAAACTDAVLSARSVGSSPAYRDVCPSAVAGF